LHLSALCELAPHLNSENANELFEACRRKTRRQVEAVLAARFPRSDVREQIRRLPVRAGFALAVGEAQSSSESEPSESGEIGKETGAQLEVGDPRREDVIAQLAAVPADLGHRDHQNPWSRIRRARLRLRRGGLACRSARVRLRRGRLASRCRGTVR